MTPIQQETCGGILRKYAEPRRMVIEHSLGELGKGVGMLLNVAFPPSNRHPDGYFAFSLALSRYGSGYGIWTREHLVQGKSPLDVIDEERGFDLRALDIELGVHFAPIAPAIRLP